MMHLLDVDIIKKYMQVIYLMFFHRKKLVLMMANVIFSMTDTKLSNSATLVHTAKAPAIRSKDNKRSRFAPHNLIDSQPQGWHLKGKRGIPVIIILSILHSKPTSPNRKPNILRLKTGWMGGGKHLLVFTPKSINPKALGIYTHDQILNMLSAQWADLTRAPKSRRSC